MHTALRSTVYRQLTRQQCCASDSAMRVHERSMSRQLYTHQPSVSPVELFSIAPSQSPTAETTTTFQSMFSPRPFPVVTLLLHALCQLHLVCSQSNMTTSAPTANSTIANSTITQPLLWNFTYPNTVFESVQLVSYKDLIRASWTPLPANETTTLQINCWNRNGTTTPICLSKYLWFAT